MVALQTVMLGHHGEIHAGDKIPASFTDSMGVERPTDWERLLEIGVIDALPEPPKRRGRPAKATAAADTDDGTADGDGDEADDAS